MISEIEKTLNERGVLIEEIKTSINDIKKSLHQIVEELIQREECERIDRIERLNDGDDEDEELQDALWNQQMEEQS